jgi:heme exporter protein C
MTATAAERSLRRSAALMLVALALLAGVFVRALAFTPPDAIQGPAQKIFYIHAPSAWVALLSFVIVGVCSVLYLALREPRIDRLAASCAEVGVVFITGALTTGPIWGKTIWGAWWTWDARLTSTLFVWFIFFGYLVMRSAVQEPGQRARFSAVLGILGALLVPFIHVSVVWFRTLHPQPVVIKPEGPTLPGTMLATLLSSFLVFTIFFAALVWQRYAQAELADVRASARAEADDRA